MGEASVDLADYAKITKGSSVALPLKNSSSSAILHVSSLFCRCSNFFPRLHCLESLSVLQIFIQRLSEDGER